MLSLGILSMHWFVKFLLDYYLNGNLKEFYSTIREGNCSFVAQVCSNINGRYMALVEYREASQVISFLYRKIQGVKVGTRWPKHCGRLRL